MKKEKIRKINESDYMPESPISSQSMLNIVRAVNTLIDERDKRIVDYYEVEDESL